MRSWLEYRNKGIEGLKKYLKRERSDERKAAYTLRKAFIIMHALRSCTEFYSNFHNQRFHCQQKETQFKNRYLYLIKSSK